MENKPTLASLLHQSIKSISREDMINNTLDYKMIMEENSTFYMRVIYMFLMKAKRHYTTSEVEQWLEQNQLNVSDEE